MTLEEKKQFLKDLNHPVDEMEDITIDHVYERNKDKPEKFQLGELIDHSPDPEGLKEFIS